MTIYEVRLPTVRQMQLATRALTVLRQAGEASGEELHFVDPPEPRAVPSPPNEPPRLEPIPHNVVEREPYHFLHRTGGKATPTQGNRPDGHMRAFKITSADGETFLYVYGRDRVLVEKGA